MQGFVPSYAAAVAAGRDDRRPTYLQVADALRDEISGGVARPGERLASVRDLASRFDIAAVTVQSALRVLRDEGYVASRSTRGYFVCDELPDTASESRSGEFAALRGQLEMLTRSMRELNERVSDLESAVHATSDTPPRTSDSSHRSGG